MAFKIILSTINPVTVTCLLLAAATISCAQQPENRKQQSHDLGEPAIISRNYIQDELKLSDAQEKIWTFLKETLTPEQFKRFQQLEQKTGGSRFSPAEVAFDSAYRPGFSTYPEGGTFKAIFAVLAQRGSPGWISAEGVNVSPTGTPGEPNMETYLGRLFNRGAVMVNVFSWGIGGQAMRNNFFRQATENPEALSSYARFLRHEALVETTAGFSTEAFQDKMHRIQRELPDWVQKSGAQAQVMPLVARIKELMNDKKFQEADKVADELISFMSKEKK